MEFSYGQGFFIEKNKRVSGTIVLDDHKLFLKSEAGDITSTYLPLDKIEKIKKFSKRLHVFVRPSMAYLFTTEILGEKKHINELTKDLINRRQLKKKFLINEWHEQKN